MEGEAEEGEADEREAEQCEAEQGEAASARPRPPARTRPCVPPPSRRPSRRRAAAEPPPSPEPRQRRVCLWVPGTFFLAFIDRFNTARERQHTTPFPLPVGRFL